MVGVDVASNPSVASVQSGIATASTTAGCDGGDGIDSVGHDHAAARAPVTARLITIAAVSAVAADHHIGGLDGAAAAEIAASATDTSRTLHAVTAASTLTDSRRGASSKDSRSGQVSSRATCAASQGKQDRVKDEIGATSDHLSGVATRAAIAG